MFDHVVEVNFLQLADYSTLRDKVTTVPRSLWFATIIIK